MKRFWLGFGAILAGAALAHQPLFNPGSSTPSTAFVIEEPEVSKVITSKSSGAGRNWYTLEVGDGFRLDVTLFVGARCEAGFKPRLFLVSRSLKDRATFELPAGFGASSTPDAWTAYSGHGVTARKGATLERTLSAGKHFLVVDHGAGKGWYFLSLGGSEVPGGTAAGRTALQQFNRCAD
jgi:hypothetical protein